MKDLKIKKKLAKEERRIAREIEDINKRIETLTKDVENRENKTLKGSKLKNEMEERLKKLTWR